jgi:choline-sulfatase
MLGEKGLWEKQQYFEASVRVPFFVRWPQRFPGGGTTISQNISLVDLFPTLCEIANVPIPEGLDGRSVVPLLEGRSEDWPDEVYSELWDVHNGPSVMVKRGDLKYIRFDGHFGRPRESGPDPIDCPDQLYDLAADPKETRNLCDDPAYATAAAELRAKLAALPEPRKKDAANRMIGAERSAYSGSRRN